MKNCLVCKKPTLNKSNKYHRECYFNRTLGEKRKCINCKKSFTVEKRGHKFSRFCSNKCVSSYYWNKQNPWQLKACGQCGEKFKVRHISNIKITCSKRECINKRKRVTTKVWDSNHLLKNNTEAHFKENEFSKNKYKYNESIIDYPRSPTGKAYIGLAKSPLMPNENGIGFQGVKLQSENRVLIQCYECGEWFKHITSHLVRRHKITSAEYRVKFGFNKNTSLVSDEHSNFLAAKMVETINNVGKRIPQEILLPLLEKGRKKAIKNNVYNVSNNSRQKQNLWGTCPLQLKEAIINYVKRFRKLPTVTSGRTGFTKLGTVKKRFGSLNNAFKECGLPTIHRMKGLVEYVFEDGTLFHTKMGKGYEELYTIMKNKCDVLK